MNVTDADRRLLLSLLDNAIMPEGPEQRERIKREILSGVHRAVLVTVGGSSWPDKRTWAEMSDTIIPAR